MTTLIVGMVPNDIRFSAWASHGAKWHEGSRVVIAACCRIER
jgi:hypothetical protein